MSINLYKFNRHWEKGYYYYPYPKKRDIFKHLLASLEKRQIVEITGLRRLGKTVLMLQLINHLLEKKVNPFHILYFSFDENQLSIEELINQYTLQTNIDYKKEKIYLFLDEIQKLDNFQNQIKIYYDLYPNIKFFISGSTSLFIRKKTQESLAGRTIGFFVKPLSFFEYLDFIEKDEILKKPILYRLELEKEFNLYLQSQFIETIKMASFEEKRYYLNSIIKKIIFEDLTILFNINHPQILYQIVQYISQNPGGVVNNLHLASELKVSNKTIGLYLSYLEDSLLIKKLYNFSRNFFTSQRKLKKYYLASPSLSLALTEFIDQGKIFENYFISQNDWQYFFRDPAKHEVDFVVVDKNKKILPIEIKFKKEIKKEDLKNLIIFMKKYQLNKAYVFYYQPNQKTIKINNKKIVLLPYYQSHNDE
jgi:hypothetical protein